MKFHDYYSLLGLSKEASCPALYEECRELFIKNHPSISKSEETFRKFVLVNDAYALLLNEEIRKDYNYLLEKYSEGTPADIADKKVIRYVMNLIIKKRKSMKEMLNSADAMLLPILIEAPLSLSSDFTGNGIGGLIRGLSFPDIDIDYNFFEFLD